MENEKKFEFIKELVKSCCVPELKQDLDSVSLQSEHFDEYRAALQQNLPILYDCIQENDRLIFSEDPKWQEIQGALVTLLCEVTAQRYENPYKLSNDKLIENANKLLLHKHKLSSDVDNVVFIHYQTRLRQKTWKRHLGTIHGFIRFLEIFYNDKLMDNKLAPNWLNFCLSAGICVRDCHDPVYKRMSTGIFYTILQCGEAEEIRFMNIHSVIYDALFKDVYQLDSVHNTDDIWNCLCRCLDFDDNIDSFNWSNVDNLMEALMRSISLCSDSYVTAILVKYIIKLSCYFTINKQEFEKTYTSDWTAAENLAETRLLCASNSSYTIFRWAKSILNMFETDSYKLLLSAKICHNLLLEMHRCYLVSILPIALPIIEPQLVKFYNNFTPALMKTVADYPEDKLILRLVRDMIDTFHQQLTLSPQCESLETLIKYRHAFQELLQHEKFVKSSS